MDKEITTNVPFGRSKWIWSADAGKKNSNVIFRRPFSFGQDKPPAKAVCRVACETHYFMYVNGSAVVWNGGMIRRSDRAYYDEIDIAKYLIKGDNVIVLYCVYYGNEGRDLVCASRAGLLFECEDLGIYSDNSFTVYENPAYLPSSASNCCYAGHSVNYDASREGQIQNVLDPAFNSSVFVPATEHSDYPDTVIGALYPRPLPLEKFSAQPVIARAKKITDKFGDDTYIINLPRYSRVTPYFEVAGNGQEKITVATDRTNCMGCFGDETSTYSAHSVEYLTKPTLNVFECMLPMTGSEIIFTMPRTVRVIKLGYRELGYNTSSTCEFETDNKSDVELFKKAQNTLYCSMGSTIVDTPERDRTMWLGDASVAARALYLTFADAAPLVKKIIDDIFAYADGDTVYSCVPGNIPVDIPSHGLLALGEHGIFAVCRNFSDDCGILRTEYKRLCDYLLQWNMTEHGVEPREGTRSWYDNLYNIDGVLLENALYYSACAFVKSLCAEVGDRDYDEDFDDRMANVADYIESTWDGLGYTSSGYFYDDRANAFVTLTGLVPEERNGAVARLLSAVQCASPYTEWAVLEALCMLGRSDLARKRFDTRYATAAADKESSALGEDFNGFGTACQSYSSAVVLEMIQLFGGIDVKDGARKIVVSPDFRAVQDFRAELKLSTGVIDVRYKYSPARVDILIDNKTSAKAELVISPERIGRNTESRTVALNKGRNKFTV